MKRFPAPASPGRVRGWRQTLVTCLVTLLLGLALLLLSGDGAESEGGRLLPPAGEATDCPLADCRQRPACPGKVGLPGEAPTDRAAPS